MVLSCRLRQWCNRVVIDKCVDVTTEPDLINDLSSPTTSNTYIYEQIIVVVAAVRCVLLDFLSSSVIFKLNCTVITLLCFLACL